MDELKEYYHLEREIAEQKDRLKREKNKIEKIQKTIVSDIVKGTRKNGTYGNICIEGLATAEYYKKEANSLVMTNELENNIKKLEDKKVKALKQIDNIERSFIRRILRLKYIDGLTWQQVADVMSDGIKEYSADGLRLSIDRYFKKV